MKRTFTVTTKTSKTVNVNGRRETVKDSISMEVEMNIEGKLINLGCDGYRSWWTEHKEDRFSAMPGQMYKLFNRIIPQEGDVWQFGNRMFVVGEKSGFIIYTLPLLENGVQVATIQFEDYYKD